MPGSERDTTSKGISGLTAKSRARLLTAMDDDKHPLSLSPITGQKGQGTWIQ